MPVQGNPLNAVPPERAVPMRCGLNRWQKLNRSLEKLSAVHDGDADPDVGDAGDAAGIKVDAVLNVSSSQGWESARMTQLPGSRLHLVAVSCPPEISASLEECGFLFSLVPSVNLPSVTAGCRHRDPIRRRARTHTRARRR